MERVTIFKIRAYVESSIRDCSIRLSWKNEIIETFAIKRIRQALLKIKLGN